MNKHRTNALLQLLVLFALAAAVVLALAWPQLPFARRESEPVEVSVILRQADAALWANARLGMEQAAGQLRAELRIVAPTADNDPAEQARLMRYEARRGPDVLVVTPAGELPAEMDVPVITLESAGGAGAVCPDNEALGRALAEAALADAPAGSVLLVDTAPGSAGVSARLAAARKALEEAGVETTETAPAEKAQLETTLAETDAAAVLLFEPSATARRRTSRKNWTFRPPSTGWAPPEPSPRRWSGAAWRPARCGAILPPGIWRWRGRCAPPGARTGSRSRWPFRCCGGRTSMNRTIKNFCSRWRRRAAALACAGLAALAAVLIDKAQKAGVPVVFFNRQPVAEDMLRWEHACYVGAKAEDGGILQGRLVLEAWQLDPALDRNGDGVLQYVMLEGEPGHQDAMLRTEYAVKTLTDAGVAVEKLASDTANWKRGQAMAKARQWLDSGMEDSIEVVFANNDDMALGAIDAFKQAEARLPLVVGVDATAPALEAVEAGELYGTVRNDGAGIARSMLDLVLALAEGADPAGAVELEDGHYVWLPYRAVTARDLEEKNP